MIAPVAFALALAAMQLESLDFHAGARIPLASMARDCGGDNKTPALRWSGAPAATKSFALVVRDPDAPIAGGFYHWIVYDIAASTHELSPGAALGAARLGVISTGMADYYGPCPPSGPAHHYVFKLYALDLERVPAASALSAQQLENAIGGHVLAEATLTALASRP